LGRAAGHEDHLLQAGFERGTLGGPARADAIYGQILEQMCLSSGRNCQAWQVGIAIVRAKTPS
jgi:hypothetical protein